MCAGFSAVVAIPTSQGSCCHGCHSADKHTREPEARCFQKAFIFIWKHCTGVTRPQPVHGGACKEKMWIACSASRCKVLFPFVYILVHIFPCSVRISVLHYVVWRWTPTHGVKSVLRTSWGVLDSYKSKINPKQTILQARPKVNSTS